MARPTSTSPTVALIYCRVSSDEQTAGHSLDAQLAEARRYVVRQQWIIGAELQDVMSGKRDDRPAYQELLSEVRRLRSEGQPVAVVVAALDRFGRSILERVRSRQELKALGVATHSVREGGEVSDLVADILASVAAEESRRLGERVQASRDHVARLGWKPSGRCPWGYTWRVATEQERQQGAPSRVLDLDPLTAPYVAQVFQRVASGESVRTVATWVGTLPPTARGSRNLPYSNVRAMLASSIYPARIDDRSAPDVQGRPSARWPALVDDATWIQVQARIAGHHKQPHQASGRYLLSGLLRCRCGCRMVGGRRTLGRLPRYVCCSRMQGAESAHIDCRVSARAASIDAAVLDQVGANLAPLLTADAAFRLALRRSWDRLHKPAEVTGLARQRQALERAATQARTRLTNAATLLVDGTIDKAGYEALRDKCRSDLQNAEAELDRLTGERSDPALPALDDVLRQLGGWSEVLHGADISAQRDLLGLLIERVVPERIARGRYTVAIEWTAIGQGLRELVNVAAGDAA